MRGLRPAIPLNGCPCRQRDDRRESAAGFAPTAPRPPRLTGSCQAGIVSCTSRTRGMFSAAMRAAIGSSNESGCAKRRSIAGDRVGERAPDLHDRVISPAAPAILCASGQICAPVLRRPAVAADADIAAPEERGRSVSDPARGPRKPRGTRSGRCPRLGRSRSHEADDPSSSRFSRSARGAVLLLAGSAPHAGRKSAHP